MGTAANRGAKRERISTDLAAIGVSVVREFLKSPAGVFRQWRPRFNALTTEVMMPEEGQSIPITQPRAWNQNGSLSRDSSSEWP